MAYHEFAWCYDEFNGEADYDALFAYVTGELRTHGIVEGILADLGCGTGDLTLMLTQAGYDVIGIDQSGEMLSVLREKADELGLNGQLLLLRQDLFDNLFSRRKEITVFFLCTILFFHSAPFSAYKEINNSCKSLVS